MAQNSQKSSQKRKRPLTENAAHLKDFCWRKGVSGNPGGRRRKRQVTERYVIVAELPLPEKLRRKLGLPHGATYADAGAVAMFLAMIKGQPGAAREIREAIEGKTTQRVELTGEDSGPIKISAEELVRRVKEFYGLGPSLVKTGETDPPLAAAS